MECPTIEIDFIYVNFFWSFSIAFVVPLIFIKRWFREKKNKIKACYNLSIDESLFQPGTLLSSSQNGAHLATELMNRGNTSLQIVAEFTEYHYFALLAAIISAALSGAAAFLIAIKGWNSSDVIHKGIFLGSAAALGFWLTIIQVFRYTDTIVKHEAIYISCANLLSELQAILHHPPASTDGGKQFSLEDYLRTVSKKCESIRSIGITFDGSKISRIKIEVPK